jgi:signal transduction histidine kinase
MDAGRLGQVVTNFLSNAIKFTGSGGTVTVRAAVLAESTPTHCSVRVSVGDTGVGLRPAEITRLFEPYSQIRAAEMQAGCVCVAHEECVGADL